jgi:type III secretion system FlhB-like substrate exporter
VRVGQGVGAVGAAEDGHVGDRVVGLADLGEVVLQAGEALVDDLSRTSPFMPPEWVYTAIVELPASVAMRRADSVCGPSSASSRAPISIRGARAVGSTFSRAHPTSVT